MNYQITPTEQALNDVSYEIGAIYETNGHWFAGLARLVEETGKTVDELTVGELRSLIHKRRDTYNRIYAGIDGQEAAPCQM
ncbi:hypothetical protein [Nitrincola sp.]|uniref:hypothetical protein n=1 Tax=Nitrincola sp. TaxID=1926584 RepID=UPI003A9084C9